MMLYNRNFLLAIAMH